MRLVLDLKVVKAEEDEVVGDLCSRLYLDIMQLK
jgi:hypothetical protein